MQILLIVHVHLIDKDTDSDFFLKQNIRLEAI